MPGLGLKRGLSEDLVISPYATALALMIMPEEACVNLERMSESGFIGNYGLYEAMDYTAVRLPRGQSKASDKILYVTSFRDEFSLISLCFTRPSDAKEV